MHYTLRGKIAQAHPYELDKTLTKHGAGAEAEATGKAIAEVKNYTDVHKQDKENPHGVTAKQLGLELVDNTPDIEKPVSVAQREAINEAKQVGASAQETADEAKETANNALARAGGAMEGELAMGNNKITGLADPAEDTDASTKKYVDSKRFVATATIPTDWSGATAPFFKAATVDGILETDNPHIFPVYSETTEDALKQMEAWSKVNRAVTSVDTITFYCLDEMPETEIPIQIEVNR